METMKIWLAVENTNRQGPSYPHELILTINQLDKCDVSIKVLNTYPLTYSTLTHVNKYEQCWGYVRTKDHNYFFFFFFRFWKSL